MAGVGGTHGRDRASNALLDGIRATLGLSESELAESFGVRASSIGGWRNRRIPASRRASVERLADLARVLRREVKATRIPQIVRTPDEWLGGRTMLDVIRTEGPEPLYGYFRRLFSYGDS